MDYYEVTLSYSSPYAADVLTAALAEAGYESFLEEEGVLKAYVPETAFSEDALEAAVEPYTQQFGLSWTVTHIPTQNWNAVWETNFQPITVNKDLRVRAVFHEPEPEYPLELVIQPKMSFGTGHHATTWLVMQAMLKMDWNAKNVLDFGTGTGILAILAKKLGAADIRAVDNDPQCIENAAENLELNHTPEVKLALGDIRAAEEKEFDIIIANITRNVIIEFLPEMSARLTPGGCILASGFYQEDLALLAEKAKVYGLIVEDSHVKDNWCMAVFRKKD